MAGLTTLEEWKNFGFRMSKKVAELSVVVHELFAKNHEKEVENEELREIYEEEIARVIADAERRLQVIAEVSHDNEQKLRAEQAAKQTSADAHTATALAEAQARLKGLLSQLEHETAERETLRSRLAHLQRALDASRRGVAEEASARDKEVAAVREEVIGLRRKLASCERSIKEAEKMRREEFGEMEAEMGRARKEIRLLRDDKNSCVTKIRQLEEEIRGLRRELVRRTAAAAALRAGMTNGLRRDMELKEERHDLIPAAELEFASGKQSRESVWSNGTCMREVEHDLLLEEVENLRQQVQQYKMELSNRDSNFSKVFNSPAVRSTSPKRNHLAASMERARRSTITKERTFSYIISQTPASEQEGSSSLSDVVLTPYLRRPSLQQPPSSPPRAKALPSIHERSVSHQRVTMRYLDGSSSKT